MYCQRVFPDFSPTGEGRIPPNCLKQIRSGIEEQCKGDNSQHCHYEEVHDRLEALGILTAEEISEQQRLLGSLPTDSLPSAWGIHRVACET